MFGKLKYHILLHIIIFIWGFTGILGKLIHLDSITIVWYRVIIAFLALLPVFILLKKPLRVGNKMTLLKICGVGIIVALHWVTFYHSIKLSTASLGILCLSTTTIHVAWLEPLIMKRKFNVLEFIFGAVVIYGIYFVSEDFSETEYLALAFGLTSALLAALFAVFNAKLVVAVPSINITLYEMLTSAVFLTVVLLFSGNLSADLFSINISDLLWLLFLGVVCTSFAFLVTIEIVKYLGAFTVSLSINLEPVYTIILAIFILHENTKLNNNFYIGAFLIVVVVIINAIIKSRYKKALG